jgi:hypothetical protein
MATVNGIEEGGVRMMTRTKLQTSINYTLFLLGLIFVSSICQTTAVAEDISVLLMERWSRYPRQQRAGLKW